MSYDIELAFAKELALEAGKIMMRFFRSDEINTVWKEDNSPLTVADTTINQLVIEKIKARFPDHGVHGEELSVDEGSDWMWLCDPIDGTMPFSIGLPTAVFSLALTHHGQPQFGVVYDPFCDRLYWAQKGSGAFLNGKSIRVSHQTIKNSYVGMDSWATGNKDYPFTFLPLPKLRDLLLDSGTLPLTVGSSVMVGTLIAGGEMAGEIFGVTKPEDMAALKVIVEEAGGRVTDLAGKEQRYDHSINGAIVSNGIIHDKLLEIVKRSIALAPVKGLAGKVT